MAERPEVRGGRAAMQTEKVSAAQIQVYLRGMDYPARKNELVRHARDRGAPENIMKFIQGLEDRTYTSAADVEISFGKEKCPTCGRSISE